MTHARNTCGAGADYRFERSTGCVMSGATAALAAAAFAYFVFGPLADERTTQLTGTPAAAHGSVGETPAIVARGPN